MSGVTQVDGLLTSVDSTEVERAGAAAAAEARLRGDTSDPKYSASETLTTLRTAIAAEPNDGYSHEITIIFDSGATATTLDYPTDVL